MLSAVTTGACQWRWSEGWRCEHYRRRVLAPTGLKGHREKGRFQGLDVTHWNNVGWYCFILIKYLNFSESTVLMKHGPVEEVLVPDWQTATKRHKHNKQNRVEKLSVWVLWGTHWQCRGFGLRFVIILNLASRPHDVVCDVLCFPNQTETAVKWKSLLGAVFPCLELLCIKAGENRPHDMQSQVMNQCIS